MVFWLSIGTLASVSRWVISFYELKFDYWYLRLTRSGVQRKLPYRIFNMYYILFFKTHG